MMTSAEKSETNLCKLLKREKGGGGFRHNTYTSCPTDLRIFPPQIKAIGDMVLSSPSPLYYYYVLQVLSMLT